MSIINPNKCLISIATLLLLATKLSAQNDIVLSGFIRDGQTNRPIEGVSVLIRNSNKGASTDERGVFKIHGLTKGDYTIVASFVGYGKKELLVKVTEGVNQVEIVLISESKELSAVTVVGQTEEASGSSKS